MVDAALLRKIGVAQKGNWQPCPPSLRSVLFPPHHTAGFPEKAVAHYQQAIQLSPSHHVAVVNLGRLYRSLGENSMAEEWYRRALQVTRTAEVLSPLGALYYNTGRHKEALEVYQEAVSLQPSQRDLRLALVRRESDTRCTLHAESRHR